MWLTFSEYCEQRTDAFQEMAQSKGDPKTKIELDDEDRDFIAQAVAKGISPATALRTRYTLLLSDEGNGESGPIRFIGSGRRPFVTIEMERTHLKHLREKLAAAGATQAAQHGFTKAKDDAKEDGAFSRANAGDILKKNKAIDINYGVETGSKVRMPRKAKASPEMADTMMAARGATAEEPAGTTDEFMTKPVPKNWSTSYMKSLFADKSREHEVNGLMDLKHLPNARQGYDFSDVWQAVHSLVGDISQPDKYIMPEVWASFQMHLPQIGYNIYSGVARKLKEFDPSALENIVELKQAMMQTTAMILSDPLRNDAKSLGASKTGNSIEDVATLFNNGKALTTLASSLTSQGYVRKTMGAKTNNTRRQEIGGTMAAAPVDANDMGKEEKEFTSDTEIAAELSKIEPTIEKIRDRLAKNNWDTDVLDDYERDMMQHYEDMMQKQRRFQDDGNYDSRIAQLDAELKSLDPRFKHVMAKMDAAKKNPKMRVISDEDRALQTRYQNIDKELKQLRSRTSKSKLGTNVRQPSINVHQPQIAKLDAELKTLEPRVQPIIAKLDASNWDMSRVADQDWDLYQRYEKIEKELKRLRSQRPTDVDDLNVPVGLQHRYQQQEVAGAVGTLGSLKPSPDYQVEGDPCSQVVLGFNAWCKNRKKKKDK